MAQQDINTASPTGSRTSTSSLTVTSVQVMVQFVYSRKAKVMQLFKYIPFENDTKKFRTAFIVVRVKLQ